MKISVIVPSFNMKDYIASTLRSIIAQKNEQIELIVVDGGSTDGTVDVIKSFGSSIDYFVSEKDSGMYDAITKGFEKTRGDIISWLNADDVYFPWTLKVVRRIFEENEKTLWLCGVPAFVNEDDSLFKFYDHASAKVTQWIANGWYERYSYGVLQQESMFWRRSLYDKAGGLNLSYNLAADFELWTRFARHADLWTVNMPLAAFRMRRGSLSKSQVDKYLTEVEIITKKLGQLPLHMKLFGKNPLLNRIIRLMTWRKTKLIHQPLNSNTLKYEERYRSFSAISISQLFLESSNRIHI